MTESWPVLDLFSGCGGMSAGFAARKPFEIVAAVDLEHGKPCEGAGVLDCNSTYAANIGVTPLALDLSSTTPGELNASIAVRRGRPLASKELSVLIACPPCTDFSRAKPANHLADGSRNGLVTHCGDFVEAFMPEFVVMENARELMTGRHNHHVQALCKRLSALGYDVSSAVHFLSRFGLPQIRERALIIASRISPAKNLGDLWEGFQLTTPTVRNALQRLKTWRAEQLGDPMEVSPGFTEAVRQRMEAIPGDGGSWFELARNPRTAKHLTPSMKSRWKAGDLGSHPDVYGRMSWDKPAPTIKRECAHVGNGRYAHPVETRLLTVREMATLQGFPFRYTFPSRSLANRYRHIGDAVPPMISYQISALLTWMKTGVRPTPKDWILPDSALALDDVVPIEDREAA